MEKYEQLSVLFQSQNKVLKMKTNAITVKAGRTFELPIVISKPGTTVHWVFHSKVYDIRFGIVKGTDGEHFVDNTVYAPDTPQQGKVVFPEAGDYYLVWDNSYSWFHEKNIVYSVEIVQPDLTIEERVACSRAILEDIEKMKKAIANSDAESKQKQSELSELVSEREKKCAELDAMKKQILEIEEKMKTCEEKEASLHADAEKEAKKIEDLSAMAPFLLEGDRIESMLTGPELLRLGCVNKTLFKSVHREDVWLRSLKQDSEEDRAIVLKNEWAEKKWKMMHAGEVEVEEKESEEKDGEEKKEVKEEENEKEVDDSTTQ
ncbi:hypothetical protein WA588_006209 [Blastocystis sp. NMH]